MNEGWGGSACDHDNGSNLGDVGIESRGGETTQLAFQKSGRRNRARVGGNVQNFPMTSINCPQMGGRGGGHTHVFLKDGSIS